MTHNQFKRPDPYTLLLAKLCEKWPCPEDQLDEASRGGQTLAIYLYRMPTMEPLMVAWGFLPPCGVGKRESEIDDEPHAKVVRRLDEHDIVSISLVWQPDTDAFDGMSAYLGRDVFYGEWAAARQWLLYEYREGLRDEYGTTST